mmetsp:Transcript_3356/g.4677  ORF Transcript_3356/g.4677 Transcript_3356/m.4677 type:complete len:521 (+) Transcript_3356:58-1620(+)
MQTRSKKRFENGQRLNHLLELDVCASTLSFIDVYDYARLEETNRMFRKCLRRHIRKVFQNLRGYSAFKYRLQWLSDSAISAAFGDQIKIKAGKRENVHPLNVHPLLEAKLIYDCFSDFFIFVDLRIGKERRILKAEIELNSIHVELSHDERFYNASFSGGTIPEYARVAVDLFCIRKKSWDIAYLGCYDDQFYRDDNSLSYSISNHHIGMPSAKDRVSLFRHRRNDMHYRIQSLDAFMHIGFITKTSMHINFDFHTIYRDDSGPFIDSQNRLLLMLQYDLNYINLPFCICTDEKSILAAYQDNRDKILAIIPLKPSLTDPRPMPTNQDINNYSFVFEVEVINQQSFSLPATIQIEGGILFIGTDTIEDDELWNALNICEHNFPSEDTMNNFLFRLYCFRKCDGKQAYMGSFTQDRDFYVETEEDWTITSMIPFQYCGNPIPDSKRVTSFICCEDAWKEFEGIIQQIIARTSLYIKSDTNQKLIQIRSYPEVEFGDWDFSYDKDIDMEGLLLMLEHYLYFT